MHASSSLPSTAGWLYVLELAPSGWVKVGHTAKIGARLTTHIANAGFGGATITRTFSAACGDAETAEDALLAAMHAHPGAALVHGRETFSGVPFAVAAHAADRVVASQIAAPRASESLTAAVMAALAKEPLHTDELLAKLATAEPTYARLTARELASALREYGIRPCQLWRHGRNRKGYRL